MKYEDLKVKLQSKVASEKVWIDEQIQKIAASPLRIGSSYTLFEAIAKVHVYMQCVSVMELSTEEEFWHWLKERALLHASQIEQSTSPTSNLLADYERVAWAKVARNNSFLL